MKDTVIKSPVFDFTSEQLGKGKTVKATGLGKFKVIKVKARKSHSVVKGRMVNMKGYNKVKFTATKSLKDAINK